MPATDPLQDESGLDAAALTDHPVTNDTDPSNATGVAIDGPAQAGMTLAARTDDIQDPEGLTGATFSYQWMRGDDDILNETSSTYTVTSADVGENVGVRVEFTDDGGNPESPEAVKQKAVPAAAKHCDALTVWCATMTAGVGLEEADPGDFFVDVQPATTRLEALEASTSPPSRTGASTTRLPDSPARAEKSCTSTRRRFSPPTGPA